MALLVVCHHHHHRRHRYRYRQHHHHRDLHRRHCIGQGMCIWGYSSWRCWWCAITFAIATAASATIDFCCGRRGAKANTAGGFKISLCFSPLLNVVEQTLPVDRDLEPAFLIFRGWLTESFLLVLVM